jgi:hypothetical protein
VWKDTPTISLNEYYQASTRRAKLLAEDFWKETAIEVLRDEVEELKRWRRNLDEAQRAV